MISPAGPPKGPNQGQEWERIMREGCCLRQGLFGSWRPSDRGSRLDHAGRWAEGRRSRDHHSWPFRQDAGIARRSRDQRRSEGEPRETHFLAQVKEHSGNPERTTTADKARHRKLLLSRQSLVPAALGSSGRPGNRRRWVASGAPRDTSGVVLVSPGVVRLRGRRGAGRPAVAVWIWSLCFWAFLPSALARSLSCPPTGRASRTGHTSDGRGGTRLGCQYQVSKGAH